MTPSEKTLRNKIDYWNVLQARRDNIPIINTEVALAKEIIQSLVGLISDQKKALNEIYKLTMIDAAYWNTRTLEQKINIVDVRLFGELPSMVKQALAQIDLGKGEG